MSSSTLPDETVIKFSKKKILALLLAIGILGADYLFWNMGGGFWNHFRAVMILLIGLFMLYMSGTDLLLMGTTRLIISIKGITDSKGNFYAWSDIEEEKIVNTGKFRYALLFTAHKQFNINIDVSELAKDQDELKVLINEYRRMSTGIIGIAVDKSLN